MASCARSMWSMWSMPRYLPVAAAYRATAPELGRSTRQSPGLTPVLRRAEGPAGSGRRYGRARVPCRSGDEGPSHAGGWAWPGGRAPCWVIGSVCWSPRRRRPWWCSPGSPRTHDGNPLQVRVGLDLGQHVEAAAPGLILMDVHLPGRRRVDLGRLAVQEGQSRLTGVHGVQRIDQVDLVEGLLRAPGVRPRPPKPRYARTRQVSTGGRSRAPA